MGRGPVSHFKQLALMAHSHAIEKGTKAAWMIAVDRWGVVLEIASPTGSIFRFAANKLDEAARMFEQVVKMEKENMSGNDKVLSNLIGKTAMISMGMTADEVTYQLEHFENEQKAKNHECWRRLGECGEIVALFMNSDKNIETKLKMSSGQIVSMHLDHLNILGS